MIVYRATRNEFLEHADTFAIEDIIADAFLNATGKYASVGERRSWQNSLQQMSVVLNDDDLPEDLGIGVEFGLPQSSKRIDLILSGLTDEGRSAAIIVELKQWSTSELTKKDGVIRAQRGGSAWRDGAHPSYQAWSYAAYLQGFNEAIYDNEVELSPCAYLHNYRQDGVINNEFYSAYIEKAPLFFRGNSETTKLRNFIKKHLVKGDAAKLLFEIENGRIRPSKMLADSLASMLRGNQEFILIDDQKVAYETALASAQHATSENKQVVIVKGGPGTGKTVVAVHLLAALTKLGLLSKYISRNAAPREVYATKLAGTMRKVEISALFGGPGNSFDLDKNVFDCLIVDEAHRLNEKGGFYGNLGENQIKELIHASKCSIFFVDDHQVVTLKDIGSAAEIRAWTHKLGAEVVETELPSQFRCGGSDGYLSWLDDTLEVEETANDSFDKNSFDFQVFDSPAELHCVIEQRNAVNNKSRMVAGYCWNWASKKNPDAFDIVLPEFNYEARWNLTEDGSLWILAPESVNEVGCIHTCQGLELDYVGVIIGPDMRFENGEIIFDPSKRSGRDKTMHGWKTLLKENPELGLRKIESVIRNTYRTLMTRGMKGCYIYCTDEALSQYFRAKIKN